MCQKCKNETAIGIPENLQFFMVLYTNLETLYTFIVVIFNAIKFNYIKF